MDLQVVPTPAVPAQLLHASRMTSLKSTQVDLIDQIRKLVDAATVECCWRSAICVYLGSRLTMNGWLLLLSEQFAREMFEQPSIIRPCWDLDTHIQLQ